MVKVLFICLGNICRSPMAEGLFRNLLQKNQLDANIIVDSAGTGDWHIGKAPDKRAQLATARRGIDLSDQKSRLITNQDIAENNYLICMDKSNMETVAKMAQSTCEEKLFRFLDFLPNSDYEDIPDPYYGNSNTFDLVLDLIESASDGLLSHIKSELGY